MVKKPLHFCRERHNVPGGDNQRGKDQQAVITAMLKKCLSPTMLLKANAIMEQVSKDIETNMSQEEINASDQISVEVIIQHGRFSL